MSPHHFAMHLTWQLTVYLALDLIRGKKGLLGLIGEFMSRFLAQAQLRSFVLDNLVLMHVYSSSSTQLGSVRFWMQQVLLSRWDMRCDVVVDLVAQRNLALRFSLWSDRLRGASASISFSCTLHLGGFPPPSFIRASKWAVMSTQRRSLLHSKCILEPLTDGPIRRHSSP